MVTELKHKVGDLVQLQVGGYGGLNFYFLMESDALHRRSKIIALTGYHKKPYLVQTPKGETIEVSEADFAV